MKMASLGYYVYSFFTLIYVMQNFMKLQMYVVIADQVYEDTVMILYGAAV